MGCGCGKVAKEAFGRKGYVRQDDGWWIHQETGDRVHDSELEEHHFKETFKRPGVAVEAAKIRVEQAVEAFKSLGDD
jgi:hypothetical protein